MEKKDLAILGGGIALGISALLGVQKIAAYKPDKVWTDPPEYKGINASTAGARSDKELPRGEHKIQLYSLGTPNGVKVTILLEELVELYPEFEYDAWLVGLGGDQFGSGFVDVNPNSKIPAMMDYSTDKPTRVFESISILMYIAVNHKGDCFIPKDHHKSTEMMNWLIWQVGSAPYLGGGFGHFYKYCPVKYKYPIDRFSMEAKRQLDVLDKQLAKTKYIAGEDYTLADMAIWPWYGNLVLGRLYDAEEFLSVHEYTNVIRWAKMLDERPAVRRGRMVNRVWGEESMRLRERHNRKDFEDRVYVS